MKKTQNISSSELEVIQILWQSDKPMSIQEVCDALPSNKWAYKTVGTLLMRMEEKEAVKSQKIGRVNYYSAVLDKEKYTREQTENLVSKLYNGSVKELAASLFRAGEMTKEDIEELREMFDL